MSFLKDTLLLKRIVIIISFSIVTLILWNTYSFFKRFKNEERLKMEIVATAMKEFATNQDLEADVSLEDKIIKRFKKSFHYNQPPLASKFRSNHII